MRLGKSNLAFKYGYHIDARSNAPSRCQVMAPTHDFRGAIGGDAQQPGVDKGASTFAMLQKELSRCPDSHDTYLDLRDLVYHLSLESPDATRTLPILAILPSQHSQFSNHMRRLVTLTSSLARMDLLYLHRPADNSRLSTLAVTILLPKASPSLPKWRF